MYSHFKFEGIKKKKITQNDNVMPPIQKTKLFKKKKKELGNVVNMKKSSGSSGNLDFFEHSFSFQYIQNGQVIYNKL